MSLSRLFEITNLLLINKSLSAKYLADYFGVSTRTIYRDIDKLTLANIPIYSNMGKNGGFSILEEYTITKQIIDKEDQINIINALNQLPITTNRNALNKLSALFDIKRKEWIKIDFKPWYEIEDNNLFDKLKYAIIDSKEITFNYCNNKGEISKKNVYPYKVYFKSYGWYLIGYDKNKKVYRTYKITRFSNLEILNKFDSNFLNNIDESKYFTIEEYSDKQGVVLKISKEMSFRVYDEFSQYNIATYADYFIVKANMRIDEWTINYLLSFVDKIEVIEPLKLKKMYQDTILKMMEKL